MILKIFLIFIIALFFGGACNEGGNFLRESASSLEGSAISLEARGEQSRSRDRRSRDRESGRQTEESAARADEKVNQSNSSPEEWDEMREEEELDIYEKELDYEIYRALQGYEKDSEGWRILLGNKDYDVLLQNALDYAKWRKPILEKEIKKFKSGLTPKQRDFFSDSENLSYLQMRTKKAREWAINTKHQLGLTPEQIKQVHRYLDYQRPELGRLGVDIPKMQREQNDRK